jgi:16S rRNA (adenine1518-N6/adenine1519-N6)-dimethyltransferase
MFLSPQKYFRTQEARPRKRFGQHFLAQPATAERIVQSADLEEDDVAVEIGPGLGALTQFILPKASRLHLVEIDRDMAEYLETHMPPSNCDVRIHLQDVMQFDFASLSSSEGKRLVLLGNLPYNISSPLMFHLLESISALKRGVFMVQKEVGERLAAGPGTKDYGVLSVLLGVYARVTPLFDVGPGQFHPPPKVDSSVLRIDFMQELLPDIPSFSFLRRLVNTAFQQRRKTLRNSLKALVGKDGAILETAFSSIGVEPNRRPETLSPEEFLKLGEVLERHLST